MTYVNNTICTQLLTAGWKKRGYCIKNGSHVQYVDTKLDGVEDDGSEDHVAIYKLKVILHAIQSTLCLCYIPRQENLAFSHNRVTYKLTKFLISSESA